MTLTSVGDASKANTTARHYRLTSLLAFALLRINVIIPSPYVFQGEGEGGVVTLALRSFDPDLRWRREQTKPNRSTLSFDLALGVRLAPHQPYKLWIYLFSVGRGFSPTT
ncbi:hypothetical protein N5P32_05220 [Marinomonas pontica]|uniref:hypothetical protein n=1 Tax=Marinomonas pontica TaxID=264739 RepID=UPI0022433B11|nr:hypothetical protein [Marinomonas pontica]MCW8355319.1 hypothetical protein [Marinomonas pontica]